MKFVLRDDDACAMTRPEELERCYASIWDEVPVCLSVTPFRVPEIPDWSRLARGEPLGQTRGIPLEENRELVEFLKDGIARGRLHVALHGYHHDMPGGQPEYAAGKDLARKTIHGKQYVEALLGCRISTFVPPNNTLSAAGFAAVVAAGLNVVNRQNHSRMTYARISPDALAPQAMIDLAITLQYSLRNRLGRLDEFSIRHYLRFKQACYFTAGPSIGLPELQEKLRACPRDGGIYLLATHYHAFDRSMKSGETIRDAIFALIDEARSMPGTDFVDYDAIWQA